MPVRGSRGRPAVAKIVVHFLYGYQKQGRRQIRDRTNVSIVLLAQPLVCTFFMHILTN